MGISKIAAPFDVCYAGGSYHVIASAQNVDQKLFLQEESTVVGGFTHEVEYPRLKKDYKNRDDFRCRLDTNLLDLYDGSSLLRCG